MGDAKMGRAEAEAILRDVEYWHYPFELPWGRASTEKIGHDRRHEARRRHFFEPLLESYGGSLADRTVLDLGCCQGFWSFQATKAGAAAVYGFDGSESFIREARALRAVLDQPAAAFQQAHLEEDPWWNSPFLPVDITLFLGLFYHLTDPVYVMRRAMAVTRETIVVDTVVVEGDEPSIRFRRRNPDEPTTKGSGLSSGLRAEPTLVALKWLLRDGGFKKLKLLEPIEGLPRKYQTGRRLTIIGRR